MSIEFPCYVAPKSLQGYSINAVLEAGKEIDPSSYGFEEDGDMGWGYCGQDDEGRDIGYRIKR